MDAGHTLVGPTVGVPAEETGGIGGLFAGDEPVEDDRRPSSPSRPPGSAPPGSHARRPLRR